MIGEIDANDQYLVFAHDTEFRVPQSRIQKKDTTLRPTSAGKDVLVLEKNNGGYAWWEARVIGYKKEQHMCTIEWIGKYEHPDTKVVPRNNCIVAQHYTEERKKRKQL